MDECANVEWMHTIKYIHHSSFAHSISKLFQQRIFSKAATGFNTGKDIRSISIFLLH